VVLIPLWLQTSMGYNALWSGRVMAVQGVLAVLLSPVVGANIGKTDPRRFVFAGVLLIAGVMFLRAGLTTQANFWAITIPQIMMGAGMPFFFIGLNTIALGSISAEDTASGAGILNFIRTTAGAFAVSLTTTSWSNASTSARVSLAGRLNTTATLDQMQSGGMSAAQALSTVDQLAQQQAVMLATDGVFTAMSVILAIAACSIWLAPRPTGPVTLGEGGH
jgi:DHA2 family multidrug resistance protein